MTVITQADREAAAAAYNELTGCMEPTITADDMAGDWLARRFAAHRLTAIEQAIEACEAHRCEWEGSAVVAANVKAISARLRALNQPHNQEG